MILISAGHYPEKPGACYEGFCEFDEANRWVDQIILNLNSENALKVPSGTLKPKVQFINSRGATLAIEIHFNSATVWDDLNHNKVIDEGEVRNVGRGSLCLYYPGSEKGKAHAQNIQDALVPIFGTHWNGVMEGYYRMNKKFGPDFFLAKTKCPSVIVEPEFIHHKELLTKNRIAACHNIAEAIREFL